MSAPFKAPPPPDGDSASSPTRTREYQKPISTVLTALLALWALFQAVVNVTPVMSSMALRMAHVMALLTFSFLLYKGSRKGADRPRHILAADLALALVSIACLIYMMVRYPAFARTGRLTDLDTAAGLLLILLVFEAARRTGFRLLIVALMFFSYFALWGRFLPAPFGTAAFTLKRVVKALAWDAIGIFGTGVNVSATYIFVFVLFGSFLKHSGFSAFLNDLALALVGRAAGGPAKVSVIASALMGMINGSAVANVATTGVITIPLMKKTGYKKEFAAAVEAAASTGGQFTPPIMGAVGFVMAEFMGVGYTKVLLAAAIPAVLYYLSLLYAVHLEAKRLHLKGLSTEEIPDLKATLRSRGHLAIPLVVLFVLMLLGFTPLFSAIAAIVVLLPVSCLRRETRMTPQRIFQALADGSRGAVSVGVCCALIGIIIGSVNMTGLGVNFGALILKTVGPGQTFFCGLMVMIMAIVLGMGVPGVASYVIVYAVAVPVLKGVGISDMAANLFCLIYACLGNITPPVAMSSYVASGIAGSAMGKTSLTAVRLAAAGFIVPFFFLDNPALLLGSGGASLGLVLRAVLTACVGVLALTKGLSGLPSPRESRAMTARLMISRALLIASGLLFISVSLATDLAALVLLAAGVALERLNIPHRKETAL